MQHFYTARLPRFFIGLVTLCLSFSYHASAQVSITCPGDITQANDLGECSAVVTYTPPVGTGSGTNITTALTGGLPSGSAFPVGVTQITFEVTNDEGDTDDCSFFVIVEDQEDPVFDCPASIFLTAAEGDCDAIVNFDTPTASDNCAVIDVFQFGGLPSGSSFPVGESSVDFQALDAEGNSAFCRISIFVEDVTAPTITCPDDITVEAEADCEAVVNYTAPVGTDACTDAITTQTGGLGSGSTFPLGTTVETYTVEDEDGNTASCSFNVNVVDVTPPAITCPADIVVAAPAGTCEASVSFPTPAATDHCPDPTVVQTEGPLSGSFFPTGVSTVTFEATDGSGNTSECSFTVTVTEDELPTIDCPADITADNDPGTCGAVVNYTVPEGTDNCPGATTVLISGLGSGGTFPVGTSIETYTVTDASGNFAECSFEVTVLDSEAPVLTCPAQLTATADSGACETTVTFDPPEATDNCGNATVTQTDGPASGSTFEVGSTEVTFTATDDAGNSANCTITIVVTDEEDPVIDCPADVSVTLDEAECQGVITFGAPTVSDNCPGVAFAQIEGPASGETVDAGVYTITFEATDAAGNTATCAFTAEVIETNDPVFDCPADLTVDADAGACEAVVNFDTPTATDPCSDVTVTQTQGPASGSTFPAGATAVEFTATDEFGNTATCSFTITVVDDSPPLIACPEDVEQSNDPGECGAVVAYAVPTATDNCGDPEVNLISGPASGDFFAVGATEVTYQATDLSGNTSACTFTVTVTDQEAPVLTCPDDVAIVLPDGDCETTITYPSPAATDNCAVDAIALTEGPASGDVVGVGVTVVSFEATDLAGNASSCSFTITVTENVPPTIDCPADITVGNDPGACGAVVTYVAPEGADNCPGATTSLTEGLASGATFPVGSTLVTYTVTDLSGNTAECSFTVTVEDTEPPVFDCPENATLPTDAGACEATLAYDLPTVTDNCDDPIVPVLISGPSSGDAVAPGNYTIVFEATDAAGNSATCSFDLTVVDQEAPTFTFCPDDILIDAASGNCSSIVNYADPTATDNCAIDEVILVEGLPSGTDFPVGVTTVTYEATDASGNTATCTFTVTVTEDTPPAIECPEDVAVDNDPGTCSAVVSYPLPTATDDCGDVTLELIEGLASGSAFDAGITTVTYEATDISGNTATCSFTVTVTDTEAPVFECPADVTLDNDANECGAVFTFDLPAATDNCDETVTVTQTTGPASGSQLPLGETLFEFEAVDAAGNAATCSYTVTLTDTEAPAFSDCPEDFEIFMAGDGCTATATWEAPSATDNCEVTISQIEGPESGSELAPGTYVIAYEAEDNAGNATDCAFSITVSDTLAPVFACPESFETCDVAVSFDVPIATDNCEVVDILQTAGPTSGSNFPLGISTITFEATDASGNVAVCSFDIERLAGAPRADAGEDVNICDASSVALSGNDPTPAVGTWFILSGFGDIDDINDPNTIIANLPEGITEVVWSIDPANGCPIETDTLSIIVEPGVEVMASPDVLIVLGGQTDLFASGLPPGGTFLWEPEDGLSCTDCPAPTASPNVTTTYVVSYTSPLGCTVSDSLIVRVFTEFPNTITPNDDGVNDVWNIPGIADYPNAEVKIFNRWGTEVFSSTGYNEPWDGSRNGDKLPAGSYFYIIDYNESGMENLNGTVNIIR